MQKGQEPHPAAHRVPGAPSPPWADRWEMSHSTGIYTGQQRAQPTRLTWGSPSGERNTQTVCSNPCLMQIQQMTQKTARHGMTHHVVRMPCRPTAREGHLLAPSEGPTLAVGVTVGGGAEDAMAGVDPMVDQPQAASAPGHSGRGSSSSVTDGAAPSRPAAGAQTSPSPFGRQRCRVGAGPAPGLPPCWEVGCSWALPRANVRAAARGELCSKGTMRTGAVPGGGGQECTAKEPTRQQGTRYKATSTRGLLLIPPRLHAAVEAEPEGDQGDRVYRGGQAQWQGAGVRLSGGRTAVGRPTKTMP